MKALQSELTDLLKQEEESKKELLMKAEVSVLKTMKEQKRPIRFPAESRRF